MQERESDSALIRAIRRLNLLRAEKRRYSRKACYVGVKYVVRGHSYDDLVTNISSGGACIRTQRLFLPGDAISLDFSFLGMKMHIEGQIAWGSPRSIGIEFGSVSADAKGVRYDFGKEDVIGAEKEVMRGGKVRKKTVRWESSAGAQKYRLYWSTQGPVGYESEFAEIENKTLVILPDEIPSLPKIAGNIQLGITAVNAAGSESDITIARVYVDFTVPEAPKALTVED